MADWIYTACSEALTLQQMLHGKIPACNKSVVPNNVSVHRAQAKPHYKEEM